jgi:hypothetical protein
MRTAAIYFLIAITCYSCNKQEEEQKTIAAAFFPNETNNYWQYKYWDGNFLRNYDTIDVRVIGTTTLPDGQVAQTWAYKSIKTNYKDTQYVITNDTIVKIYSKVWGVLRLRHIYKLPLVVGNTWFVTNVVDTAFVLPPQSIVVPAGTYLAEIVYRHRAPGPNIITIDTTWFKSGIGIVKYTQGELELGPVLGTGRWDLIQYSVQ